MTFGTILQNLRKSFGYSQLEVVKLLEQKGHSIKQGTLSSWEVGTREPDIQRFFALCDIYDVKDIRFTFTGVSSDKDDMLEGFNQKGRKHILNYVDLLREDSSFIEEIQTEYEMIRLYDIPVSAGTGEFLDESDYEEIPMVSSHIPNGVDFAVRAAGDSMEPEIYDGQILFIKKMNYVRDGEIGIFILNGDAYCKRLEKDKLVSLNKKYPPIKINEYDSFHTFGKVLFR